jgi:hypothetical protein
MVEKKPTEGREKKLPSKSIDSRTWKKPTEEREKKLPSK